MDPKPLRAGKTQEKPCRNGDGHAARKLQVIRPEESNFPGSSSTLMELLDCCFQSSLRGFSIVSSRFSARKQLPTCKKNLCPATGGVSVGFHENWEDGTDMRWTKSFQNLSALYRFTNIVRWLTHQVFLSWAPPETCLSLQAQRWEVFFPTASAWSAMTCRQQCDESDAAGHWCHWFNWIRSIEDRGRISPFESMKMQAKWCFFVGKVIISQKDPWDWDDCIFTRFYQYLPLHQNQKRFNHSWIGEYTIVPWMRWDSSKWCASWSTTSSMGNSFAFIIDSTSSAFQGETRRLSKVSSL